MSLWIDQAYEQMQNVEMYSLVHVSMQTTASNDVHSCIYLRSGTLHWFAVTQYIQFKILTLMRNWSGRLLHTLRVHRTSISLLPDNLNFDHLLDTYGCSPSAKCWCWTTLQLEPSHISLHLRLELISLLLPHFRKRLKNIIFVRPALTLVGRASESPSGAFEAFNNYNACIYTFMGGLFSSHDDKFR